MALPFRLHKYSLVLLPTIGLCMIGIVIALGWVGALIDGLVVSIGLLVLLAKPADVIVIQSRKGKTDNRK